MQRCIFFFDIPKVCCQNLSKIPNNYAASNLSFAAKDIQDIGLLLKQDSTTVSFILVDSNATREKIQALKTQLKKTTVNDKVIIVLSGHGTLHNRKDFYFGTYDIDFDAPDARGLKYEELEYLLDDIPARKKLLLIDACHSGEVDTSAYNFDNTNYTDPKLLTTTGKNDPENDLKQSIGLENSFELMKELFADLSRGNGTVVISAAKGLGFAEEDKTWQNGAFTLCLKAAFNGNNLYPALHKNADQNGDGVSINELKEYILTNVPVITDGRQRPTTRKENISVDWKLW